MPLAAHLLSVPQWQIPRTRLSCGRHWPKHVAGSDAPARIRRWEQFLSGASVSFPAAITGPAACRTRKSNAFRAPQVARFVQPRSMSRSNRAPRSAAPRPAPTRSCEAGVGRVVIGATDPNPLHGGRGIDQLRAAGLKVTTGVLADECCRLNEAFNKWIVTGKPFVIAKCGMSLDGRLTRAPNEGRWMTGPVARRHAMQLRAQVDAILIGAETLRRDNPRLTTRGMRGARQPWRVVLSRSGKLPRTAHLFADRFADRTLVYQDKALRQVLADLGRREITSVLIEGGGNVLGPGFRRPARG